MTAPTAPGADGRRVSDDELADYVSNIGVGGYTQTEGRQFILDLCDARQALAAERARADKAEQERDDKALYAERLQIALTGLAGGGSENFVRHGDGFRADIRLCQVRIEQRQMGIMESLRGFAKRAKDAEAALSTANARIELLEAQRGGQVTEEGIEAVLGAANPLWFWIKANQSVGAESLRARVRKALTADPAPARAEQDGEGRS